MMRTFEDYPQDITELSKSVLLELITLLKGYRKDMILVGGWTPYFILQKHQKDRNFKHVGSADIDLVIDPDLINRGVYETIVEIIEGNGFQYRLNRRGQPVEFSFEKIFRGTPIHVDFISTVYPSGPRRPRHVQPDLQAATLKGAAIALRYHYKDEIKGKTPNGTKSKMEINIVNMIGCLGTKGYALGGRSKAKDDYDIYSIVSYYKDGYSSCANEIRPYIQRDLELRETMEHIREEFQTLISVGPENVGRFIEPYDEDARRRVSTDAFMRVNRFLELLSFPT